ncbi:MAG: DUF177 domain-containing protein [Prevotellaceae bacterium]|jgi:uncharacterized metal-binding protein YceD (DUF177 family)|nr:DUF177 domain-containing protein [Prevotellaceae bacterium]
MSEVRNYIRLPLRSLEKGKHTFDFSVDTGFFSEFQNPEIIEGAVEISLDVEKFSYFMNVVLTFSGTLTVTCDRCLEDIDIPVEDEYLLSVRFGDAPEEPETESPNEDVIYVNAEDEEIDLAVYVYESICLALPIQRVHGDDDNGNSLCNPVMLKYIINN